MRLSAVACTDEYLELSGTSMAAPMVAGAAIRMIGREPTLNPGSVKARLMSSWSVYSAPTS
ncbi:MAG: S8 family serine peptidase [Acidobacteriota bacterium]|nr:S8 family serine peptidase [Acidobacteriota bacterium]MDH3784868.1 S8 family serine peptidase [Acidobacteriota bacterium]